MAKRISIIIIICLSLFFPGLTWGILYYYSGSMDSSFEVNHEFVINVPEGLTSLTFITPLPEDYSLPRNTQEITGFDFTYDGTPIVEDYTDTNENHFKKLIWTNPDEGVINMAMNYTVSSSSDWSEIPGDAFPFDSSGLPESVTDFLLPSEEVQSDAPVFINLAEGLTNGADTQWEAMAGLMGWVIDNIRYGDNSYGFDALSTMDLKTGNCSNFAHIAIALARAAGIPARFVNGYSLTKSYSLPTGNSSINATWGQGSHAWIEVYYSSLGWISYDPQRDLHHVDTHRFVVGRGIDAKGTGVDFSWTFDTAPSSYPAAYHLLNVDWIHDNINLSYIKSTNEVSSFSISSAVPFTGDHTITTSSGSGGRILPDGNIGVADGASQTFSITPGAGYETEDVLVDGVSQGAISTYTFNNLTSDHTITVRFRQKGTLDSGSSCFIDTLSLF